MRWGIQGSPSAPPTPPPSSLPYLSLSPSRSLVRRNIRRRRRRRRRIRRRRRLFSSLLSLSRSPQHPAPSSEEKEPPSSEEEKEPPPSSPLLIYSVSSFSKQFLCSKHFSCKDGTRVVKSEGYLGLYKGLVPLWGRQIPYTMMKFASFETVVGMIYKYVIPTPKGQCSKPLQLGVSFAGGYVAGVFCAIVSHPADNLVSLLNNAKGATVSNAVKQLGLWGLFTRGLPLRIVMIGTLTGAQWGIYDAFKVMVGLPTTGGVAPAATPATENAQLKASA